MKCEYNGLINETMVGYTHN